MTTETQVPEKDGIFTVTVTYKEVRSGSSVHIVIVEVKEYCVFGFTILIRERFISVN